ncbi:MAG: hypothetical protein IPP82_08870 [Xanthomonadales bacterium]|nr:hypothetical protein [Xanthomonadales bacterium]
MPSQILFAKNARLLSNGNYTVMLTDVGSGFSRWKDLAITRWREDPTVDGWGSYILVADVDSGAVWSAGVQPCAASLDPAVCHPIRSCASSDARKHLRRCSTSSWMAIAMPKCVESPSSTMTRGFEISC